MLARQALRAGVLDVLPQTVLDPLTAEDLRLLVNGVEVIAVPTLISYTSFNDESGETSERLVRFKRWLWQIVEKMTKAEKQDLVRAPWCAGVAKGRDREVWRRMGQRRVGKWGRGV